MSSYQIEVQLGLAMTVKRRLGPVSAFDLAIQLELAKKQYMSYQVALLIPFSMSTNKPPVSDTSTNSHDKRHIVSAAGNF